MPNKAWFWIALTWTIIIAVLCLVSFTSLPSVKMPNTDKYVHATLHFFFTIFWHQHLKGNLALPYPKVLGWSILLSIAYGTLIEWAQECFTATRHADFQDIAANFAGALVAVLLLGVTNKRHRSKHLH